MKRPTLIIVEDHQLIREAWSWIFTNNGKMQVLAVTGSVDEAVELVKNHKPDMVLLDLNLQDASGLDAIPLMKKYAPGTNILVITWYNQIGYVRKIFRLGAKAYITKGSSYSEMILAIEQVLAGNTYICDEMQRLLHDKQEQLYNNNPDLSSLSIRELEVVKLIKKGLTSKEIASKLSISVKTAEIHRYRIMKKLKLKNAASLAQYLSIYPELN